VRTKDHLLAWLSDQRKIIGMKNENILKCLKWAVALYSVKWPTWLVSRVYPPASCFGRFQPSLPERRKAFPCGPEAHIYMLYGVDIEGHFQRGPPEHLRMCTVALLWAGDGVDTTRIWSPRGGHVGCPAPNPNELWHSSRIATSSHFSGWWTWIARCWRWRLGIS